MVSQVQIQLPVSPYGNGYFHLPKEYHEKAAHPAADAKNSISHKGKEKEDPSSLTSRKCALCDNTLSIPQTKLENLLNRPDHTLASSLAALKIRHLSCGHLASDECYNLTQRIFIHSKACNMPYKELCNACDMSPRKVMQIKVDSTNPNSKRIIYNAETVKKTNKCALYCLILVGLALVVGLSFAASISLGLNRRD